jgi:CRP-like cAMP-binding protein
MKIEEIAIYSSIENYLDRIPVIRVKKGDYIVQHEVSTDTNKYYILSGIARVVNHVGSRKLWIDEVGEDCFTGDLSKVYHQYFNCDIVAAEDTTLLTLTDGLFYDLLKEPEFANIFYKKMSQRVYIMYKRMLINNTYSQRERLSSYIIQNAKYDKLVCPCMNYLCEVLGFSRRSLYNTFDGLVRDGLIEKQDNYIIICNREKLEEQVRFAASCTA